MATNNWDLVDTDEYNMYEGDSTQALPGSPIAREHRPDAVDQYFFPMSTIDNSMMDKSPDINGPVTDFWSDYPITIDVSGYIFYRNHNTGINVRGPAGITSIQWADLTPEQRASLKGEPGINGINGRDGIDGVDGVNGKSAYDLWIEAGHSGTLEDFFAYLANAVQTVLIKRGTGDGSAIVNYDGAGSYASGKGAFATGYLTSAEGENSFTTGTGTRAVNANQTTIGSYNSPILNSIFEIGNGTDNSHRSNALVLSSNGNFSVAGSITDGSNNVLSNKVDKVTGKQLSTNDFTNYYKDWIDNFTVDLNLIPGSINPISSGAVYNSIQAAMAQTSKPNQALTTSNEDLSFFHPSVLSDGTLELAKYTNNLTWNPNKQIFKNTTENIITNNKVFAFGQGLTSASDYQIIIGKYNEISEDDIFQIGYGASTNSRKNFLHLNKNGDFYVFGDITDGNGNVLDDKQDKLVFDNTIIQNSQNMVNSGTIYDYLVAHGINPDGGLNIPEIATLQAAVVIIQNQISTINTTLESIGDPRIIEDDSIIGDLYTYGIDNGEFYIKLIEDEDDNEEEEGGE